MMRSKKSVHISKIVFVFSKQVRKEILRYSDKTFVVMEIVLAGLKMCFCIGLLYGLTLKSVFYFKEVEQY